MYVSLANPREKVRGNFMTNLFLLGSSLQAAKTGEVRAANNLGVCHEKGMGTEEDHSKAVYWYSEVRHIYCIMNA